MGPEFIGRVVRTSAWVAPLTALYVAVYYDLGFAAAILTGTAWACANLYLITFIVKRLVRLGGGRKRDAILLGCVKFPVLYGLGYLALRAEALPVLGLLAGFWIPKAVIILKNLATLVNRRSNVSRGSVTGICLVVALGLWLAPQLGAGSLDVSAGGETAATVAVHGQEEGAAGATSHGGTGSHAGQEQASGQGSQEAESGHGAGEATAGPGSEERAASHGEEHEGDHGEEGGGTELPNFVTVIRSLLPEDSQVGHFLHQWENLIFSLISMLILGLIVSAASRKAKLVPDRLQNTVELLVEKLDEFICGILGPQGRRYVPFLGSLFLYILFMNLFGLVPGMKSPTANLNQTLALALCVFLYVQYTGMRNFGIKGYIFHMAGEPRDPITFALVPIMLPLHIIGELAKPLSLSLRLFGNITGEDVLIVIFVSLGIGMIGFLHLPIGLPLQVPFIFLAMLTSTIQALVFTLLSTVYLLMMMPHEEH